MECRICYNKIDKPFLSLGNSPLANSYIKNENLYKIEQYFPLDIFMCENCHLVQIDKFIPELVIFSSDYAYFSSCSTTMLRHCKNYVDKIMEKFNYDKNTVVIEIGSNDGYLLQYFKEYDINVLGIEPATEAAKIAIAKNIPTDITFFNLDYAKKIRTKADLIIGNNVLAHNPDLNSFVQSMKVALKPDGLITIEFPHLLNLIRGLQFDTIYHEHYSYLSLSSTIMLFERNGLTIFDVEEIPIHGGSLRIYAKHREDKDKEVTQNIPIILDKEKSLLDIDTYSKFSENVKSLKREILTFLINIKKDNKKIVGYGAPAKGNTLLNYCGIRDEFIDYTVDINYNKQNKFLPGSHIPILHPDKIKEDKPDYVLILPWNIKDEIISQLDYIKEWNGKFIILVPEPMIINSESNNI